MQNAHCWWKWFCFLLRYFHRDWQSARKQWKTSHWANFLLDQLSIFNLNTFSEKCKHYFITLSLSSQNCLLVKFLDAAEWGATPRTLSSNPSANKTPEFRVAAMNHVAPCLLLIFIIITEGVINYPTPFSSPAFTNAVKLLFLMQHALLNQTASGRKLLVIYNSVERNQIIAPTSRWREDSH